MFSIKKLCNFLIFGKISLGHKEQEIFEERVTEENSISYHFTTELKIHDEKLVRENDDKAIRQDDYDMGHMVMMFPFSPPGDMSPVEEISDYDDERKHWHTQVKRKRSLMIPVDESPFKKHKCRAECKFVFVSTVNPAVTKSNIPLAKPPTKSNRRVRVVKSAAPYHIPKKRQVNPVIKLKNSLDDPPTGTNNLVHVVNRADPYHYLKNYL